MNRPSPLAFVLGHRASTIATGAASVITTLAWLGPHSVSWYVPAIALYACKSSFTAKRRITVYREWRSAWAEMAGVGPEPEQEHAPRRKGAPVLRVILGGTSWLVGSAFWLLLLCWLWVHASENTTQAYGAHGFWWLALTVWGAVAGVRGLQRRNRPTGEAADAQAAQGGVAPQATHIVAHCLPVPSDVRPSGHVRDRLPDYCQQLFRSQK